MLKVTQVRRTLALAAIAAAICACSPTSSSAALTLRVDITGFDIDGLGAAGTYSTTIVDQVAGDNSAITGLIRYSIDVGSLSLSTTVGSSKPFTAPNPGPMATMGLHSVEFSSGGFGGTITISLSDKDFSLEPVTGHVAYVFVNSGALNNASASAGFSMDTNNQLFGSPEFSVGPSPVGNGSSGEILPTPPNPFSLTLTQIISVNGGNSDGSVDTKLTLTIPELSSFAPWMTALPVLAFATFCRRRRHVAA